MTFNIMKELIGLHSHLNVALECLWHVEVDDGADVGLVDAHPERHGRNHDPQPPGHEVVLFEEDGFIGAVSYLNHIKLIKYGVGSVLACTVLRRWAVRPAW